MNWDLEPEYNLILFEKKGGKIHTQIGFSGKTEKNVELDVKEKSSSWDKQKWGWDIR